MSSRRWREDWQRRAQHVHRIIADNDIAMWRKSYLVGHAFQDVDLGGLKSKHRKKMLSNIAAVNAILAKYPIKTFDDYVLIEVADLKRILASFKNIADIKVS